MIQHTKAQKEILALRRRVDTSGQQRQLQSEELILNQLTFDNEGKLVFDNSGILVLAQPQV